MALEKPTSVDLSTPVQFAKGVGPNRAKTFAKLGVETLGDLLEYFPRRWDFMPEPIKIKDVKPDKNVCIAGIIESTDFQPYRRTPMFEAIVADETGFCKLVWFHGAFLKNQLQPGQVIAVSGKSKLYKHQLQIANPKFVILEQENTQDPSVLAGPSYPATGKLTSNQLKRIIKPLVPELAKLAPEFYPDSFLEKNELIARKNAYLQIHSPEDEDQLNQAKRRLKYDELFLMQLGLAVKRYQTHNLSQAKAMHITDKIDSRIRKRFPFLLTGDQDSVIEEIITDMKSIQPMNRLLQGDVGSGKTVVAVYAALVAIANKSQVAIMAPTEILAAQHLQSIQRFLKGSSVTTALITGKMPAAQRKQITADVKSGKVNILVGTVALLNEQIDFHDLGLVIIDEQHKFGVHQRAKLRKANTPHCLVMTATPIPRTLAMTAFGDLDISIIKHKPPGRGKVVTRWVQPHDRTAAFDFIRQRLRAKKQAYFVYPRIESQEDQTSNPDVKPGLRSAQHGIKAAIAEHKVLSKKVYPEFNVGLLHGQMKPGEKEDVMASFRKGKLDLLVSTVVIEVGVDIPNATIMVIEEANRFGLAQLHQLRGRIGRGQSASYCFLFAETEDEDAVSRLDIMTQTNDGFRIAEHDLKIRGPGELFSTRQHGLPDLKIANIVDDFDLLTLARKDAFKMITKDPLLKEASHRNIRNELIKKFGKNLKLANIA
jgi:ATP-dependent DNA helicase RecG